jgi:hypothetical protein
MARSLGARSPHAALLRDRRPRAAGPTRSSDAAARAAAGRVRARVRARAVAERAPTEALARAPRAHLVARARAAAAAAVARVVERIDATPSGHATGGGAVQRFSSQVNVAGHSLSTVHSRTRPHALASSTNAAMTSAPKRRGRGAEGANRGAMRTFCAATPETLHDNRPGARAVDSGHQAPSSSSPSRSIASAAAWTLFQVCSSSISLKISSPSSSTSCSNR